MIQYDLRLKFCDFISYILRNKGTEFAPQNVTIPAPYRAQSCIPKEVCTKKGAISLSCTCSRVIVCTRINYVHPSECKPAPV